MPGSIAVQALLSFGGFVDVATRKSILAFRGRNRKLIRELREKIRQVLAMDLRASDKSVTGGVPPTLFKSEGATNHAAALTQLKNRCDRALTQRVGMQAVPQVQINV